MTEKELKAEAKAKGYKLIKMQPKIPFENCPICGADRRLVHPWFNAAGGTIRFRCDICGFGADDWAKTEIKAKIFWNNAVKQYKEAHHA